MYNLKVTSAIIKEFHKKCKKILIHKSLITQQIIIKYNSLNNKDMIVKNNA